MLIVVLSAVMIAPLAVFLAFQDEGPYLFSAVVLMALTMLVTSVVVVRGIQQGRM